jgi:hypothetical protein
LDDGVLVFDSFDERGVGGRVALVDYEAGMREEFGGKFGGVAQVGGAGVVLEETGC